MAGGSVKWCSCSGKWFVWFPRKPNIHLPYGPSNCAPGHLFQRRGNLRLHRHLYTNVHGWNICNISKVGTAKMSSNVWVVKLWSMHTTEYYSIVKRNGRWIQQRLGWCQGHYAEWKRQFHKVTYCMIPCVYHSWNVPGIREKGHYVSVWGGGGGLWGDRTVLYDCSTNIHVIECVDTNYTKECM